MGSKVIILLHGAPSTSIIAPRPAPGTTALVWGQQLEPPHLLMPEVHSEWLHFFPAQHRFFCCHSTLPSCSPGEGCLCSPDPFAHSFGCGGGITPASTTSPDGCRALIQASAVPSRLDRVNTVHLRSAWGWYTQWLNDKSQATKEAGGTVWA